MKPKSPLKLFGLFAAGLVLPGLFLGYQGFRSLQYERLLTQQQMEERHAADGALIEKKAEDRLQSMVSTLGMLASNAGVASLEPWRMIPVLLQGESLSDIPTTAIFAFDDQNRMIVPVAYESVSHSRTRLLELDWGTFRDDIVRLEQLEFVEKNISQAIQGYLALESQVPQAAQRAALLKNAASGYRKLKDYPRAERIYLKLMQEYDQIQDPSGYPMGILARQLLIRLYQDIQSPGRAMEAQLDLYENLVLGRWQIPLSKKEPLVQDLQKQTAGAGRRLERIQALQRRLDQLLTMGRPFARDEWPDLFDRMRKRGWLEQGGVLATDKSTERLAIVAPIRAAENRRLRGWLVAEVHGKSFWPVIENSMMESAKPFDLLVEISRSQDRTNASRPGLEHVVNQMDPPLHFRLLDTNVNKRDQLSHRRRWIFGGMVGLSFLVIIGGIIVMARAAQRETEAADLKADFVANVSHELRTPLAAISHIGERLSLGRYRSEEEQKEFYGLLGKETNRLRLLVEDVLDFSKMLAGKKIYRQERLDLSAVVQEAHEHFEAKAEAKGFDVALQLPGETVPIRGDRRSLLQAVLNLMDNAMKYSGDSRKIAVRVSQTGGRAQVAVQDYGVGIADADKEKIFEKFYRSEQASESAARGVGLGLAMVKHIIDGHAGIIRVDSQLGKGSTFYFELPLASGGPDDSHPHR